MKIVVTGSSKGIGKQICLQLIDKGHTVIGLSRNKTDIDSDRFTGYIFDITSPYKLDVDKIDVLVNNAGVCHVNNILTPYFNWIETDFNVNLYGTMKVTSMLLPKIVSGGKIINITSEYMSDYYHFPGAIDYIGYALSKNSLNYYTKILAHTLPNIKVICACPGFCETEMSGKADKKASEGANDIVYLIENDVISGKLYANKTIREWQ